jgi:phytoene synthase
MLQRRIAAIISAATGFAAASPSRAPLIVLIDAHAFDLYGEPMPSVVALEDYVRTTEVNLLTLASAVLGARDANTDALCEQAGLALGFALVLRRFAGDAARRRLFLPADILAHHHADAAGIFAGRADAALLAAVAEMRRRTRSYLDAAALRLAAAPRGLLPALLPAALVRPRLKRMERAGLDPFAPGDLAAPQRQWLTWRAARNPRRIFA